MENTCTIKNYLGVYSFITSFFLFSLNNQMAITTTLDLMKGTGEMERNGDVIDEDEPHF